MGLDHRFTSMLLLTYDGRDIEQHDKLAATDRGLFE